MNPGGKLRKGLEMKMKLGSDSGALLTNPHM